MEEKERETVERHEKPFLVTKRKTTTKEGEKFPTGGNDEVENSFLIVSLCAPLSNIRFSYFRIYNYFILIKGNELHCIMRLAFENFLLSVCLNYSVISWSRPFFAMCPSSLRLPSCLFLSTTTDKWRQWHDIWTVRFYVILLSFPNCLSFPVSFHLCTCF